MVNNYLTLEDFKNLLYSGLLKRVSSKQNLNLNMADNLLNVNYDELATDFDLIFYLSSRKDVKLMKLNPIMHMLRYYKTEKFINDFIFDKDLTVEEIGIYMESNRMIRISQKVDFPYTDSESNFKDFILQRECRSLLNNSLFYPEIDSVLNYSKRTIGSSFHLSNLLKKNKILSRNILLELDLGQIKIDEDTIFIHVQDFFLGGTQLLAISLAKFLQTLGLKVLVTTNNDTGELKFELDLFNILYINLPTTEISSKLQPLLESSKTYKMICFSAANLSSLIKFQEIGFKVLLGVNEPLNSLDNNARKLLLDFTRYGECIYPYYSDDYFEFFEKENVSHSNENSRFLDQVKTGVPFSLNLQMRKSNATRTILMERFGIKPGSLILGSLASGVFRKGFDRVEKIISGFGENVSFVWVGKVDLTILNSLPSNLFIIESLNNEEFFSLIDIYCCLSRDDVYPMSVTESLMRGVLTLTFDADSCGQSRYSQHELLQSANGSEVQFKNIIEKNHQNNQPREPSLDNLIFNGEHSKGHFQKKISKKLNIALPSISVILPYYNHANYSYKRLESILMQDLAVSELIMLNDGSTDYGFDLYKSVSKSNLEYIFKIIENEVNDGNVFNQWVKGIENSTAEFVWIAETDDFSHPAFTLELVSAFTNEGVAFASCNSLHIAENEEIIHFGNPYFDFANSNNANYDSSFVVDGKTEMNRSLGIYNSIPNVSACLFKTKILQKAIENIKNDLINLKYAGDWLLYVELSTMGNIAYSPLKLNYFRKSDESTIGSSDRDLMIKEISFVQERAREKGFLSDDFLLRQRSYLETVEKN
jgi:glycosyltransferase involved in cell wall biosynthesis